MSGFEIDHAGDMTIDYGTRRVLDTAGNFVVGASNYGTVASPQTISVTFPDFTKGWISNWKWQTTYIAGSGGKSYGRGNRADSFISAPKQDWSATTILGAAPAGANFFFGRVRFNRTTAPANNWNGQPITVKPVQNKWITYSGSILVEAQLNMARAFSLYIDSGNLVLHRQQSVGPPPGFTDYGTPYFNDYYGDTTTGPSSGGESHNGGEWAYDGVAVGYTIYNNPATMSATDSDSVGPFLTPGSPAIMMTCRRLGTISVGAKAPSVTDTTNYLSTYSVDIAGKFCRAY